MEMLIELPKRKKLRLRNEDDDDLLEQREDYAEDASDDNFNLTYGICDWCDTEHYLVELGFPWDAEICQFCVKNKMKELEKAYNKLRIVTSSSP
jgi:hypothetical protein